MKYLKRFNESLNENSVVDDLIDYLSSNVLIYDLNNLKSTIYSSDTLKEISVISGDTECISFSFENKEVKIYVPKYEYNSYLTINHNNIPTFNNLKLPINSNFLYLKINNMLIDQTEIRDIFTYNSGYRTKRVHKLKYIFTMKNLSGCTNESFKFLDKYLIGRMFNFIVDWY